MGAAKDQTQASGMRDKDSTTELLPTPDLCVQQTLLVRLHPLLIKPEWIVIKILEIMIIESDT